MSFALNGTTPTALITSAAARPRKVTLFNTSTDSGAELQLLLANETTATTIPRFIPSGGTGVIVIDAGVNALNGVLPAGKAGTCSVLVTDQ